MFIPIFMRSIIYVKWALLLFAHGETFAQQAITDTGKTLLKSENYISRYGDMSNTIYRIKNENSANVVFKGGSITFNPG